ncbi:MAG: type II secretion system protein GspG [Candidatus Omnitrophica bacterium]|nr:type II secretion system protein GspG [Candidatus Omnitrophota bacterium]
MRYYKNYGITLIEIVVSMFIIFTIGAISLPVLHRARNKATITKTKAIINTIEAALSVYETDFGDYPYSDGNSSKILVEVLQGPCQSDKWNGPYIRFKKDEIDKDGNILDSWKTPIIYKYPQSDYKNVPFLLISAGSDRKFGTKDDIGNW